MPSKETTPGHTEALKQWHSQLLARQHPRAGDTETSTSGRFLQPPALPLSQGRESAATLPSDLFQRAACWSLPSHTHSLINISFNAPTALSVSFKRGVLLLV